jgi:hypothetical protein
MRRLLVCVRWAPLLLLATAIPLTWVLLPYLWSDFKEDLR